MQKTCVCVVNNYADTVSAWSTTALDTTWTPTSMLTHRKLFYFRKSIKLTKTVIKNVKRYLDVFTHPIAII